MESISLQMKELHSNKIGPFINNFSLLVKLLDYYIYIFLCRSRSHLHEKKRNFVSDLKAEIMLPTSRSCNNSHFL